MYWVGGGRGTVTRPDLSLGRLLPGGFTAARARLLSKADQMRSPALFTLDGMQGRLASRLMLAWQKFQLVPSTVGRGLFRPLEKALVLGNRPQPLPPSTELRDWRAGSRGDSDPTVTAT